MWEQMLSSRINAGTGTYLELMLSCGRLGYHGGRNAIMWEQMVSSGSLCHHLGPNSIMWRICCHMEAYVIMWDQMLSCVASVIMWRICYHVENMLSCSTKKVLELIPSGFYYMLESPQKRFKCVFMLCYHLMLSCGIKPPSFFIIPENLTHSDHSRMYRYWQIYS
jgi:hypothetical protein